MFSYLNFVCGNQYGLSDIKKDNQDKTLDNTIISLNKLEKKKFDLENISGNFYVESVYDGDTITILVPLKTHIYNMTSSDQIDVSSDTNKTNIVYFNKIRLRLFGIDTPEIKPKKDIPNRDVHISKAKEARDFLSTLILNKIIKVEFLQNDKYGRPLAKIYHNNICLNNLMIEKEYAKKYDGGAKDSNF
jgi:endonuclease YncB( thermonuclease family)